MSRPPIDDHVTFLFCSDLARSEAFYRDVIGLELVLVQQTCRIFRVCGSAYLGVCERDPGEGDKPIIVTLVSDELEAWHGRLTAEGVACDGAPRHNPKYDIVHFFATDPDGYKLEFQRFLDPAWPGNRG